MRVRIIDRLRANDGFTLIEVVIVMVVLSVMAMILAPRVSRFLGDEGKHFNLLTSLMARTYDDAFIHDNVNYLALHLHEPFVDDVAQEIEAPLRRTNGVSVLQRKDGTFVDHPRKSLRPRTFPPDFKLVEVILASGEKISSGNVLVPYYPQGYSDNLILHVLVGDEDQWSIRTYKHLKEAEVRNGFLTFEDDQ
jgi:prepilin-type N-terminal cleavage/methylation domain-containing protein